ncbi:MAG TPA: hypothetical protein VHY91_14410 [Pirellulales bacterium]|jgi:hypothetical protein|nr:hypothetical protein [Pirellulales bacterium]
MNHHPNPDPATVAEFLRRLGHPVAIVGRKPLDGSGRQTVIWPAETDDPADVACGLAYDYQNVYVNLNELTPDALAMVPEQGVSIRDAMIARRSHLLIDIDGPPKEEAREQFAAILDELGEPLIATDSGNGYGLIYTINLPSTRDNTVRVTTYLRQLKDRFPRVDIAVASASRLTRVIGTLNRCKISGERIATHLLN